MINLINFGLSLFEKHTVLKMGLVYAIAIIGLVWHQSTLQSRLVKSTAVQNAAMHAEAIEEFRALYTSEVVEPALAHGLQVTHDYREKTGAIPLPATLSMLLGNRLANKDVGGQTGLYSPYPFPWRRETGGLRDDFGREAWEALTKHPETPFYRFQKIDGRPSLRYATADLMKESCVNCHNNHPDTPKRGWKEGDVRGVLEVVIPLDATISQAQSDRRESFVVIAAVFMLGLFSVSLVIARLRRFSADSELLVVERTIEAEDRATALKVVNGKLTSEIEQRKKAEVERQRLSAQVIETSRQAGMAEVATGVLHNVGNVLNSVNVSACLLMDKLQSSRLASLAKASDVICQHQNDLATFFTTDEHGQHFPRLLAELTSNMAEDRDEQLEELRSLTERVAHVKEIINMQQTCGKVRGITESINPAALVEDALKINEAALTLHNVDVVREFEEVPPIVIEKHRVLQILVNLISNAKNALRECDWDDKVMTVVVRTDKEGIQIQVCDNGVGIAEEDLPNIFNHGFTKRKDGHGFGLHSSALLAHEMGGSFSVHSEGRGHGAIFTLKLPLEKETLCKI